MNTLCRCCSGKSYADCCQPFHQGTLPGTAQQLMRSRYTAYALGHIDYIIKTTHKDNVDASTPIKLRQQEIMVFCQNTEFNGLKILDAQEGDLVATVTFHVTLSQHNKDASFSEKSYFKKENGAWLYLKGEVSTLR